MGTLKETLQNMISSNQQVMMYNALINEEQAIKHIKFNPYTIKGIENPSEYLQLIAVQRDPDAIRYITNPTEKTQLEAVQRHPQSIKYISNPSKKSTTDHHTKRSVSNPIHS
ncbi:hypothetical protein ACIXIL_20815 [Bacteroides fragilis]